MPSPVPGWRLPTRMDHLVRPTKRAETQSESDLHVLRGAASSVVEIQTAEVTGTSPDERPTPMISDHGTTLPPMLAGEGATAPTRAGRSVRTAIVCTAATGTDDSYRRRCGQGPTPTVFRPETRSREQTNGSRSPAIMHRTPPWPPHRATTKNFPGLGTICAGVIYLTPPIVVKHPLGRPHPCPVRSRRIVRRPAPACRISLGERLGSGRHTTSLRSMFDHAPSTEWSC